MASKTKPPKKPKVVAMQLSPVFQERLDKFRAKYIKTQRAVVKVSVSDLLRVLLDDGLRENEC